MLEEKFPVLISNLEGATERKGLAIKERINLWRNSLGRHREVRS